MTGRVVGLDLSITATGIATDDGTILVKPKAAGDTRLGVIAGAVIKAVVGARLVVIEDLPANAKSAGITGMVQGAVRHELIRAGVPYVLVIPSTLKLFATGRGNAGKPEMAVAAFKRAGAEFADDNQCDAWWLWVAGKVRLGMPPFDLPQRQLAALDQAEWPNPRELPPATSACCNGTGLADYAAVPCEAPGCPSPSAGGC